MIKKVFCDVDGTLCTPEGPVTRTTFDAIEKLQAASIDFILCTGRSYCGLKKIFADFGRLLPCICHLGADYHDENGNVLFQNPISRDAVLKIIELSEKLPNNGLAAFTNDYQLINHSCEEFLFNTFSINSIVKGSAMDEWFCDLRSVSDIGTYFKDPIYKMEFHTNTAAQAQMLMQFLSEIPSIRPCLSKTTNIEISAEGVDKGKAIHTVCALQNISEDEVVTIGDSFNDRSMLEGFRNAVAMGNASDDLKKMCAYTTCDNAHDGVAKTIERVLANEIR